MDVKIGDVYTGRVVNVVKFGAFIQITPSKQGLCHISKISKQHIVAVSDVLEEDQEVKVKVIGLNHDGKVQLSMIDVD